MKKIKEVVINGTKYTLTAKRSILQSIQSLIPEALDIANEDEETQKSLGIILYDNMDIVFYELIKTAHQKLSKEESDSIYEAFLDEYNDVDEKLLEFVYSVFGQGIPREEKKNLNW